MNRIISSIRAELKAAIDPASQESYKRYFKEEVKFYGLKLGPTNEIARKYWNEVKSLDKQEIFRISEELLKSDYGEEAFIVALWLPKLKKSYEWEDLQTFSRWIDLYINNWAKCDGFCNQTIGEFIFKFPEAVNEIKTWADSENRWMKRASAVSLIMPARRGLFLADIFEIADKLLLSKDDMVQKGYGWMLKEASKMHQNEVYDYVVARKAVMPRTAYRYAIEKMPVHLREEAMKKELLPPTP
jgi:3-methyladenine DNA glycosylase AlkD